MEVKVEDLKALDTDALLELQDQITEVLTHRRRELEEQLQKIAARAARSDASGSNFQSYGQPKLRLLPRYRSKKDPTVTWSGRGVLPKWMRAEMQGTVLSKEDFRISL
jgi:DNA-binding protein H-NS